jgi:hypothetical protein
MVRNMVAALVLFASVASAQAASQVWYSTPNINGNGAGVPGGLGGTALNLACDTTAAGSCSWVVTMHVSYLTGGPGSFAVNLAGADGQLAASNVVANGTQAGAASATNPWSGANSLYQAGTGGVGAALLTGTQGQKFGLGPVGAGEGTPVTFTLNYNYTTGSLAIKTVSAIVAPDPGLIFANNDFTDYDTVDFGGQLGVYADQADQTPRGPVIRITGVPEPTSLALLALGGLVALRRRAR